MKLFFQFFGAIVTSLFLASCNSENANYGVKLKFNDIRWQGLDLSVTFGIAKNDKKPDLYGSFIFYRQGKVIEGVLNKSRAGEVFDLVHGVEHPWREIEPPAALLVSSSRSLTLTLNSEQKRLLKLYVDGQSVQFKDAILPILKSNSIEAERFLRSVDGLSE